MGSGMVVHLILSCRGRLAEAQLVETVDALDRAMALISRGMAKNTSAFAQLDATKMENLAKSLGAIMDAASLATSDKHKLMCHVQSQQGESDESEDFDMNFVAFVATTVPLHLEVAARLRRGGGTL